MCLCAKHFYNIITRNCTIICPYNRLSMRIWRLSSYNSTDSLSDDRLVIGRVSIIARNGTERDVYADYQSPGMWRQSRPSVSAARSTAIPAGSWYHSPAIPLVCRPRSIPSSTRLGPRDKSSATTAASPCFRVGTGAGRVVSIVTQVSI